jgi:hypothetical protein
MKKFIITQKYTATVLVKKIVLAETEDEAKDYEGEGVMGEQGKNPKPGVVYDDNEIWSWDQGPFDQKIEEHKFGKEVKS